MREPPLVLVADDDEDILALVELTLEHAGLAVITARDGESALRLALEQPPRLAVLDVAMPGLDGLELTRRLRANHQTQAIPILLVTAKAQETDVRDGFAAGASAYLKKPFSPGDLAARVEELLARRGAGPRPSRLPTRGGIAIGERGDPGRPLVINADDDGDIQLLIRFVLEDAGYRVVCVGSAEAVLEVARASQPALFLLDLKLPGLSGLDLARLLQRDERLRAVPVVILTASATDEDETLAAEVGVQGYLRKPFVPAQLLRAVADLVDEAGYG